MSMWKIRMIGMLSVVVVGGAVFGASPTTQRGHADDPVLPEGRYSAKAKSLVCGGCAEAIEKAMGGVPGIATVTVDAKTGVVGFTVNKGASVAWSDLQTVLKAASDQMGMGADYRLSDFQIALSTTNASTGKKIQAACCLPHP